MKNTIAEKWTEYSAVISLDDAPELARIQIRRAFYAGALSLLKLQTEMVNADVDPIVGGYMLKTWREECDLFAQQVLNDEA